MAKYRIVHYKHYEYTYDVQKLTFGFWWRTVHSIYTLKECKQYVENKLNYVVKEFN